MDWKAETRLQVRGCVTAILSSFPRTEAAVAITISVPETIEALKTIDRLPFSVKVPVTWIGLEVVVELFPSK